MSKGWYLWLSPSVHLPSPLLFIVHTNPGARHCHLQSLNSTLLPSPPRCLPLPSRPIPAPPLPLSLPPLPSLLTEPVPLQSLPSLLPILTLSLPCPPPSSLGQCRPDECLQELVAHHGVLKVHLGLSALLVGLFREKGKACGQGGRVKLLSGCSGDAYRKAYHRCSAKHRQQRRPLTAGPFCLAAKLERLHISSAPPTWKLQTMKMVSQSLRLMYWDSGSAI